MNDYLWDKTGPPDPEIASLERRLQPFAFDPDSPVVRRAPDRPAPTAWAAAAAILLAAIGLLRFEIERAGSYTVELLEGRLACAPVLTGGGKIACDGATRARLHVGDIGSVTLAPSTRVRVEPGRHDDAAGYRLFLEVGTVSASIFSAPRVFQIGTPAGIAVDLGCVYSTTVDEQGRTTLRVETGAVSFEAAGRKVYVPAKAECRARPGRGPGTPVASDRDDAFKAAVARIDDASRPALDDLDLIRLDADDRDSLTFFHLLDHRDDGTRKVALDGILTVCDDLDPGELDLTAIMRRDRAATNALRSAIDWRW